VNNGCLKKVSFSAWLGVMNGSLKTLGLAVVLASCLSLWVSILRILEIP